MFPSLRADLRVLAFVVGVGCVAPRATGTSAEVVVPAPEPAVSPDSRPFREVERWEGTGVILRVPDGWLIRSGAGDELLELRGRDVMAASAVLRSWDGEPESLDGYRGDRVAWVSGGPYDGLGGLADGPPYVHSRPADDAVELGWHFQVEGTGYSFVARVPRVGFEEAVRSVHAVLEALERSP